MRMSRKQLEDGNRILMAERAMLIQKYIHLEELLKDFLRHAEEFQQDVDGSWYVDYGWISVDIRNEDVEYLKHLWREVTSE